MVGIYRRNLRGEFSFSSLDLESAKELEDVCDVVRRCGRGGDLDLEAVGELLSLTTIGKVITEILG